jgi:hypothetical protein
MNILELKKEIKSVEDRFQADNNNFRARLAQMKLFCQFLKQSIGKSKNHSKEQQLLILLVLFHLLNEGTNMATVSNLFRYLLQMELEPFATVVRLDRLDFRLEITTCEDIDRLHNWIQENRLAVNKADPESTFERLIVAEKFRKDKDLTVLQAYTDKSKENDLNFIYETLISFLKENEDTKKYKLNNTTRKILQNSISTFLINFRQSELFSPLEKVLKLGCCALSTASCQSRREKGVVNCPTCNGIIRKVS